MDGRNQEGGSGNELPPNYFDRNTGAVFGIPLNQEYPNPQNTQYEMNQIPKSRLQDGAVSYTPGEEVVVYQPTRRFKTDSTGGGGGDYMAASILTCLFCFWPVSIVAIVMSAQANYAFARGNDRDGNDYAKMAGMLSTASFFLGVITIVIVSITIRVLYL